jgi:phosphatidylserine synthase
MSVFKELKLKDYVTLTGTIFATIAIFLSLLGAFDKNDFFILIACFSWTGCIATDLFDGWIARKLNQVNKIGKEIDSLSDAISFVVVPGIIILSGSLLEEFPISILPKEGVIIGILVFIFCGITRLAWYNVSDKGEGYTGLVTPSSATIMVMVFITQYHFNKLDSGWPTYYQVMTPVSNFLGNTLSITIYMMVLGILNLAPFLRYGANMQKKRGVWVWILAIFGVFIAIMIILASIFTGLNVDIAYFIGYIFPLGFLLSTIGYILYGFSNFIALKKKGEIEPP